MSDLEEMARDQERLQCTEDVCRWCRSGGPPTRGYRYSILVWYHMVSEHSPVECKAAGIFERVYQMGSVDVTNE